MKRERVHSLKLLKLSKRYELGDLLLNEADFDFSFGELVILEGPPGVGKSLLLRMIAGLVAPSSGEVAYNNKNLSHMSFEDFAPLRLSTSFCFEDGGLLMNKSCLENLKLPLDYHRQWRKERSEKSLDELSRLFDIKKFLDLRPAQVTSGVRKSIGIMRSLLSNPQILFLDEPSLGIGEEATKALKLSIEKFRREGKGDELIIIASSDKRFIQDFKASHLKIESGKLVAG